MSVTREEDVVRRWAPLAYRIARDCGFFMQGADFDDLHQEALVGLLRGVRSFKPELGVPEEAFYALCIRRQLASALRRAAAKRQRPLTHAARVMLDDEGKEVALVEMVLDRRGSAEEAAIQREELRRVTERIQELTLLERESVRGLVAGESYLETAIRLDRDTKAVDNALARSRRKLAA